MRALLRRPRGRLGRLLVIAVLGCGSGPPPPSCPGRASVDVERTARITARLRSIDEGRVLADAQLAGVAAICFDAGPLSVITGDHVVLLDTHLSDDEAAARLGHLLVHERDGHPMGEPVGPDTDCAALVRAALVRESRAYATESRLRAALVIESPVMPFEIERETAPLPDDEASARWLAYLEAHPSGAPGIDALGAGYLAQCERDRVSSR